MKGNRSSTLSNANWEEPDLWTKTTFPARAALEVASTSENRIFQTGPNREFQKHWWAGLKLILYQISKVLSQKKKRPRSPCKRHPRKMEGTLRHSLVAWHLQRRLHRCWQGAVRYHKRNKRTSDQCLQLWAHLSPKFLKKNPESRTLAHIPKTFPWRTDLTRSLHTTSLLK